MGNDIEDLLQELEGVGKETIKTIEETKEQPTEVAEEVVVAEPVVEPEPVVEAEPVVEPEPEPEVVDEATLAEENERLRVMLNELAKKTREPAPLIKPQEVAVKSEPLKKDVEAIDILADYITAEEADNLIDKPREVLTAVMGRLARVIRETIMRDLPPVVGSVAQHQISMFEKVQAFYRDNPDLNNYRDFCVLTAGQIENDHPDWDTDQIYAETAKVAKARLGLKSKMEQKESAQTTETTLKPALPGGSRTSRKPSGGPKLSAEQQSMVDLLNLENR